MKLCGVLLIAGCMLALSPLTTTADLLQELLEQELDDKAGQLIEAASQEIARMQVTQGECLLACNGGRKAIEV